MGIFILMKIRNGKILGIAETEILFFLQQRELSPSPPSCSEPERLAGKTWSLVGEFYLQLFVTGLVWLSLVWSGWKTWTKDGEFYLQLKREVRRNLFIGSKFLSNPKEKFQKAILTEKPQSW